MNDDSIRVTVVEFGDRPHYQLQWVDPITGRKRTRSSKITRGSRKQRAIAEKAAGKLQAELREGRHYDPLKTTWEEFRDRHDAEKLAGVAPGTRVAYNVSLDYLERTVNPDRLSKLTAAVLSQFQAKLRADGMRDTTLARHLRHIKAALRWAERVGLMVKAPKIELPKRQKGQRMMRGRPITAEEFDRMLAAVSKVRPKDAPAWRRFLTGLWLSGLRLEESLTLSWDQDSLFSVDLSGRRPALRIYAEAQKARRDEVLPMTPDFAELLFQTPEREREGPVFRLVALRGGKPISTREVGKAVSAIGRAANVVVNKAEGKCATAHDLRRAFGTRWAKRVMPAILRRLMRHADIATTMAYYVDIDAAEVADQLWADREKGPSNTSGNSDRPREGSRGAANDATP